MVYAKSTLRAMLVVILIVLFIFVYMNVMRSNLTSASGLVVSQGISTEGKDSSVFVANDSCSTGVVEDIVWSNMLTSDIMSEDKYTYDELKDEVDMAVQELNEMQYELYQIQMKEEAKARQEEAYKERLEQLEEERAKLEAEREAELQQEELDAWEKAKKEAEEKAKEKEAEETVRKAAEAEAEAIAKKEAIEAEMEAAEAKATVVNLDDVYNAIDAEIPMSRASGVEDVEDVEDGTIGGVGSGVDDGVGDGVGNDVGSGMASNKSLNSGNMSVSNYSGSGNQEYSDHVYLGSSGTLTVESSRNPYTITPSKGTVHVICED